MGPSADIAFDDLNTSTDRVVGEDMGLIQMGEEKAANPMGEAVPGPEDQDAADAVTSLESVSQKPTHVDDLLAQLRRDLADYKDRNLRLLADMENLRRRTEEEKASAAKYATQRFAGDIVNLVDNFQRATGAVPAGAADADPALKSLVEGVSMTEREFLNVLERHGIKRIASLGETFSPHFHQPMMQIPNPDVPSGTILQVLQEGYMIGDRVLRAAIVTVSEGGAKAARPAAPSDLDNGAPPVESDNSDVPSGSA